MKPQRGTMISVVLLPREGSRAADEAEYAKDQLDSIGIPVPKYGYVEDHALLWIEALNYDPAVNWLTSRGLKVLRPN
jgi:hypothetical protein